MYSLRVDDYPRELNEYDLQRNRNRTPESYNKIRSEFISFLANISCSDSRDRITNFMRNVDNGVSYALAHMCKIEGISFQSMIDAVLRESNHLDENDIEFHKR